MNKKTFSGIFWLITFGILLVFALFHLKEIWGFVSAFANIIMPFLYGFGLAYLLKFPYELLRKKIFKKMGSKHKFWLKFKKPLSLIITYIFAFGIVAFFLGILIPQLQVNIQRLADNFSGYANQFMQTERLIIELINTSLGTSLDNKTILDSLLDNILNQKNSSGGGVNDFINQIFPQVWEGTKAVLGEVYNWVIAIIVSVYFLASKEQLCLITRNFFSAYLPQKAFAKAEEILSLANNKFGKYLVGQLTDAAIVGVVCYVGMSIFGFEYPLLISFIIAFTNIIPFFGPFIGGIPSAFLLLLINPWHCLFFIIFMVVLQQIDGNIIYPRIMGNSIGISGIWVLFSVILGGSLFQLPGMVLGVPCFAVIYTLVGQNVKQRLGKNKPTKADKPQE
ncbi:MAG: AI-2E family transporter [Oscillospiraceae bacterium]|nr:AI-2E family transporter [Oscillospiraceae bacterium]